MDGVAAPGADLGLAVAAHEEVLDVELDVADRHALDVDAEREVLEHAAARGPVADAERRLLRVGRELLERRARRRRLARRVEGAGRADPADLDLELGRRRVVLGSAPELAVAEPDPAPEAAGGGLEARPGSWSQ